MNKVIEIKNINKKYYSKEGEFTAIEDISLDVNEGNIWRLLVLVDVERVRFLILLVILIKNKWGDNCR